MIKVEKIKLISSRSWDDFISAPSHVPLVGDPTLLPYIKARISTKLVDVGSIFPISLYALRPKLRLQADIHRVLLKDLKINSLDLNGDRPDITFQVVGERGLWSMAPPIVEVSLIDGGKPVLVDGEHRFLLAKALGQSVRVVWIEKVPREYPVVGLPVSWEKIVLYDKVPSLTKKRLFRFTQITEFPNISAFSAIKVDEENYRYFFYRDLSPVCTTGIRENGDA